MDSAWKQTMSILTKKRISHSLKGRFLDIETRQKMSKFRSGLSNVYFGKRLHPSTLLVAQKVKGKSIYVYSEKDKTLINNSPFISIRETSKHLSISTSILAKILDTGKLFKGYYYYSFPLK